MNFRTLSFIVVNILFCSSTYALTLGDIKVSSRFGEPLKAHINVLNTDVDDSGTIKAELAEDYAYLNARIFRQSALDSLNLALTMNKLGDYVISLTSVEPINELFLELIVDIGTDDERLSREYTMLFDPVGYQLDNRVRSFNSNLIENRNDRLNQAVDITIGEESHGMESSIGEESHGMESSIGEESHGMESSIGEESHGMESSIGEESHGMESSIGEESHGMESSIGEESHGMESSIGEESHGMESSIGEESHGMESSIGEESHGMESSIGEESHGMESSIGEESHGMESSIGEESHGMESSIGEESHGMESSIGEESHDMKGTVH